MSDKEIWGVAILLLVVTNAAYLVVRHFKNRNFSMNRFDLASAGVFLFFLYAANNDWHPIPSMVLALALVVLGFGTRRAIARFGGTKYIRGAIVAIGFWLLAV